MISLGSKHAAAPAHISADFGPGHASASRSTETMTAGLF